MRTPRPRGSASAVAMLAVAVGALAAPASAQTLRGLLLEQDTQRPINLGRVTMLSEDRDSVAATITDEDGFFSVTAPQSGRYHLVASALGYRASIIGPFELNDGRMQVVRFQLGPRPVPLPGILVEAARLEEPEVVSLITTGFYDRLLEGKGEFVTPGEVANGPVRYTPQLFRELTFISLERAPEAAVASAPWNDRVLIRPLHPERGDARLCIPRLYIDDVFIDLQEGETLEDVAPRDAIEAIEVYQAPFGAPMRYQSLGPSESACGTILVWTKRRWLGTARPLSRVWTMPAIVPGSRHCGSRREARRWVV